MQCTGRQNFEWLRTKTFTRCMICEFKHCLCCTRIENGGGDVRNASASQSYPGVLMVLQQLAQNLTIFSGWERVFDRRHAGDLFHVDSVHFPEIEVCPAIGLERLKVCVSVDCILEFCKPIPGLGSYLCIRKI